MIKARRWVARAVFAHWRGQEGPRAALFVALVLCQGLVSALTLSASAFGDAQTDPRESLAYYLAAVLLSVPIEIWGWVGLFRSARGVHSWWRWPIRGIAVGGLALLSVGGAALGVVGVLGARFIIEGQGLREGSVRLEGDVLHLRGHITWGMVDETLRLTRGRTQLEIRVNSYGGSLAAAKYLVSELKRVRILELWVDAECSSACTMLFELTPHRYMTQNGSIRTHMPSAPGLGLVMDGAVRDLRESYQRAGVLPWWADRSVQTPADRFYRANTCELIDAGVIMGVRTFDGETLSADESIALMRSLGSCPDTDDDPARASLQDQGAGSGSHSRS